MFIQRERHLKWGALDGVERGLMWLSGLLLAVFTVTVLFDVTTRFTGTPVLWLQEVTLGRLRLGRLYRWGGRRPPQRTLSFGQDRARLSGSERLVLETINHLVMLGVALFLAVFGFVFCLQGLGIYSQPSGTPLAVTIVSIPVSGLLIALFTVERLVNGWRNGFEGEDDDLAEIYAEEGGAGE